MRHPTRLAILGLFAAIAVAGAAPPDEPPGVAKPSPDARAPGPAEIPFFLDTPADRDAFWKRLLRPDFVVIDGEEFRNLRAGGGPKPGGIGRPPLVASVAASGSVDDDWGHLAVEFGMVVEGDDPTWATIRLDALPIARASEGGRDLPTRVGDDRAWQVELRGRGEHRVVVDVLVPARGLGDARRVELPIPPAASTRIDLDVPRDVLSASTGIDEPAAIARTAGDGGTQCRLSARLSPRARVELAWREKVNPAVILPTLLATQGEIAVDVDRGFLQTRGSWLISAVRGTVDRLSCRVDRLEEVMDVEVEGEPAAFEGKAEAGRLLVTISLDEPLRPDLPLRLTIATRRPIASAGAARVVFQGCPFDQAKVQAGVLAISRAGPLFPVATAGRGLRRIDPRTELPEGLRARPGILLAYEFNAQPFELALDIEPVPPLVNVESRTTVLVDPRSARVDARLDCRTIQGRPFELAVRIPRGLDLRSTGPPEVVESARLAVEGPAPAPGADPLDAPRILTLTLTRPAREAESFRVHLTGRCAIDPDRPATVPLFQPRHSPWSGGRVAVLGDPDVAIDLDAGRDGRPSPFLVDWGRAPAGWEWPAEADPGAQASALWLRHDSEVEGLPLLVSARPRSIRHENFATVSVDRKGAEVADEVVAEVASGTLSRVDVALPPEVPARWEVDGVDLAARDLLGRDPDGTRRYRLRFARDDAGPIRLRFRYRVAFNEPMTPERGARFLVAPARVLEGTSSGQQVRLASDPGIVVEAEGPGWSSITPPDPSSAEAGPVVRHVLSRGGDAAGPLAVAARAEAVVPLPTLIASRLWLRTVQRPDGDLETTAWYRVESRDGAMSVALPAGSRWTRARIGGGEASAGEVEALGPDAYRVRFAAEGMAVSALVGLEYVVPASTAAASDAWPPPRLLDGVVQQALWEVQVIGTRVGVGVPDGWTDENEWYREGFLWKRRPWKGPGELAAWVAGPQAADATPDDLAWGASVGRHGYLFSRVGAPAPLPFPVLSRPWLVGLCSGPVLVVGLLILLRRPPPRPVLGGLLALAFLAGTFGQVSVILLVLQSASLGLVLMVAALLMQWWLGRRGSPRIAVAARRVPGTPPSAIGTTSLAGSDDSTAIRARPVAGASSTVDHANLESPSLTVRPATAPSTTRQAPQ